MPARKVLAFWYLDTQITARYKYTALVVIVFSLIGCDNERRSSSDFPLEQILVSSRLALEPATSDVFFQLHFISAGNDDESAEPLATVSASALLTGGDNIFISSGSKNTPVTRETGRPYEAVFSLENDQDVRDITVQYARRGVESNQIRIVTSQNLQPVLQVSTLELDDTSGELEATLSFGLEEGYELPDGVYVGLVSKAIACDGDANPDPGVLDILSDPFGGIRPLANDLTRTLVKNELTIAVPAIQIASSSVSALVAGAIISCSYELRTTMTFDIAKSAGYSDLIFVENNNKPPQHNMDFRLQSEPVVVTVHRSALIQ